MKLLGSYPSRLSDFHVAELTALMQKAYVLGEYEAGKAVNSETAQALAEQAADFNKLPLVSAGGRAMAESLNYPASLLSARYQAISRERDDFLQRMEGFLELLRKDSVLVDQLLAMAELEYWVARQPVLSNSKKFYWSFEASHGLVTRDIPLIDPLSPGVVQPESAADVSSVTMLPAAVSGVPGLTLKAGVGVPFKVSRFAPSTFTWNYTSTGENEELYGPGWAKLSLLEDRPRITFGDCVVTQILPENVQSSKSWRNYLQITGEGNSSNLPVYVKIVFLPRRRSITVTADVDNPTLLGAKVLSDDLIVHDGVRSYDMATTRTGVKGHFVLQTFEDRVNVRWLTSEEALGGDTLDGKEVTILYTEYFPAYQCSIDEYAWSQPIMLDPERMFPDDATELIPLDLDGDRFPITDEVGNPLGFFLKIVKLPDTEYLLRVENSRPQELTPGDFGANATLEIEFDRPIYMNGLYVAPFVNFPVFIRSIKAEGMTTATGETIFSGNILLDRAQTIRFDRRLIRRLFVKLYQENYTVKEHLVDPKDKDKRDAFATLQTVLPFSVRRVDRAVPRKVFGFQYEMGLRDIAGEDWTPQIDRLGNQPGILTLGPFKTDAVPEVLRFDVEYTGQMNFYVVSRKRMVDGTTGDFEEFPINPGTAVAFTAEEMAAVSSVDYYLKFVLKEEFAVVSKFLLQISHV